MDHKAFCCCRRCVEAREFLKGKQKRKLPLHVREQWMQKRMKEEEEMLLQGRMLFTCPACGHTAYAKIGRQMKCECCCRVFE